jgi:5-(carboxyamino)imidazole ribonucleotide synthase
MILFILPACFWLYSNHGNGKVLPQYFSSDFTLGILGGGQLGRMLLDETARLDIRTAVLDAENAPAHSRANDFVEGNFKDQETVLRFGRSVDLITCEIENINLEALEQLERDGKIVRPSSCIFRLVSDKTAQKRFYTKQGFPTAPYQILESKPAAIEDIGPLPRVWKAARGGYDGKGVQMLREAADVAALPDVPCLIEELIEDKKEISVLVARRPSGETAVYPAVEMVFDPAANLVDYLFSPSSLEEATAKRVEDLAVKVAEAFYLEGIMAVEMFVTPKGEVYVNEVAPRPHNSGHHTIESHLTSQHEQHLRAILDLPLGSTRELFPSVMINILGGPDPGPPIYQGMQEALAIEGVFVHIYGKTETRPKRQISLPRVDNTR